MSALGGPGGCGLLAAKRWNRIVVDVTELRSIPTALDLFDFARGLASNLPTSTRVALVVRPEQARHAKLVENVARNDGMSLTVFLDAEKATAWVKAGNRPCSQSLVACTNPPEDNLFRYVKEFVSR